MHGILIIIGIALFVAFSSFVSSTGKLIDKRWKGLKIVTPRGWFIIALNFGVIILSVLQYSFNEKELKQKEIEASNKQTKRDSILKSNYDSSLYVLKSKFDTTNLNTVSIVSQTLGEYGYLLDSTQKRLVKIIKDSSKTKIISAEEPVLSICSFEGIKLARIENDAYYFDLLFCSNGAASTGYNIKAFIVIADSLNNFLYFKDNLSLSDELQILKDAAFVQHFNFSNKINFNFLYIYVKGTYKNIDRTKTYNLDAAYYYNKIGKTSGMVMGKTREKIINYITENK